ncbi:MAG: hypothetical protein MH321_13495 [Leptospiraceae bacterium]|nr:hypothetical protein [Leptospiraceae bacterium]
MFKESYLEWYNSLNFIKIFFFLLFSFIGIYFLFLKWNLEPYGMWDSWSMWNLKAKTNSLNIIFNSTVKLFDVNWHHMDYPFTLPALISSLSLIWGSWNQNIPLFLNVLFFIITISIFVSSVNKTNSWLIFILLLILTLNFNYLSIISELCADHILSMSLLILLYVISNNINFNKVTELKLIDNNWNMIALILIFLSLLKNEGFMFSVIFLFLLILILIYFNRTNKSYKLFKYLITLIFIFFLFLFWKYFVYLNIESFESDFTFKGISFLFFNLIQNDYLILLFNKFFNYHIIELKGLIVISLIINIILSRNVIHRFASIYLFLLFLFLNLIFLFSLDISWLLKTAYSRINIVLLPSILYLFVIYFKNENFNISIQKIFLRNN